tara:strand:- start:719 stop:928 length:210 start_codon:yes stop_codon:yes gene_type:complete
MKWIEEHQKECKILDSDKCNECFHISESLWALSQAQEEMDQKKNQPKPKVETKLVYNYRLKEWRNEVIK